jgi:predicted dehydrogenase
MLKAAVIGVGAMGENHARIYSELTDVELIGVADNDLDKARRVAARYGTIAYDNVCDLLACQPDVTSLVVPTSLHRDVGIVVAEAGVNMLVEKPLADTIPAARDIVDACERNRVSLMVGHVERFNPVVAVVRREIAGEPVCLMEITRIGPFPPRIKDVGIIIDLATHDVDLIRYLTGSEFEKAFSLTSCNLIKHEDVAILGFEMTDGTLARVTTNWLTPFKVRELTVATPTKYVKASLLDQRVTEYSRYTENETYLVRDIRVPFGEPLKLEIRAFLDSVISGTPPPVTGRDGLKVLEVLEWCGNELNTEPRITTLPRKNAAIGTRP